MRRVSAVLFLALLLSTYSLLVRVPAPSAAQQAGNEYVSRIYGFRVSWDDRLWYVVDQGFDQGWEEITLSDGIAYVFFSGGPGYTGQAQPCVDDVAQSVNQSAGVDNVESLKGDDGDPVQGGDDDHAFAAYTYEYRFADGTKTDFTRYVECRVLVAGESVFIADVVAPSPLYDDELPLAQELIADLTLPSPGEPAPVFVSDQWRLAVVAAARGDRIRAAGLLPKPDKDWLVVVVDATNWGSSDDDLSARDFALRLDGTDQTIRLAPASTASAAEELGTGPQSANKGVPIPAGLTERLTLVFQVPNAAIGPTVVRAGSALPLDDVLARGDALDELPPSPGPPFLREARVERAIDGGRLEVTLVGDDSPRILRLVGIDAPGRNDCHGQEILDRIAQVVGTTVLIEREPGTLTDGAITGYLWMKTRDGTLSLFNQELIATGFAEASTNEKGARFGIWLAETERAAEADGAGLWGNCPGPRDDSKGTPVAVRRGIIETDRRADGQTDGLRDG
ncbi:MAG: micrococcal nuclease [Thermomicrobiales bacterium]|nr:micrococcal nuclease [Thermomicrobiales bacterium]